MMRLIIPFVFALIGAIALAATHAFEDDHAAHGNAFMALLAASHAMGIAEAGGAAANVPPQLPPPPAAR